MQSKGLNPYMMMTASLWAFNFVALKFAYREFTAPDASLIRWVFMTATLVAMCKMTGKSFAVAPADRGRTLLVGFITMGVYIVLFMEGVHRTSVAECSIIIATSPILTNLFAVAWKQERFHWGVLLGAVAALCGVAIVVWGGAQGDHLVGNALTFVAAVFWSLGAVLMRSLLVTYEPLPLLTASMGGALPVLVLYDLVAGPHTHFDKVTPFGASMLLYSAILSGSVGFWGFYMGVRQVGAGGAMLYQYFVPPAASVLAWLSLGAALGWEQGLGILVVIAGVAFAMHSRNRAAVLNPA